MKNARVEYLLRQCRLGPRQARNPLQPVDLRPVEELLAEDVVDLGIGQVLGLGGKVTPLFSRRFVRSQVVQEFLRNSLVRRTAGVFLKPTIDISALAGRKTLAKISKGTIRSLLLRGGVLGNFRLGDLDGGRGRSRRRRRRCVGRAVGHAWRLPSGLAHAFRQ